MGTTQFPKIPSPPVNPDLKSLSQYVSEVSNLIAVLSKELDFLLNGSLDVQNIRAKSITADTLDVDELSAITANMGHITSGRIDSAEIYGAYIATADGAYPRCEMSATNNLFVAYADSTNYIRFIPFNSSSLPSFQFVSGDIDVAEISAPDQMIVDGLFGLDLNGAAGPVRITTSSLDGIQFDDWSELINNATGHNLQQDLNAKANAFTGVSGTVFVAATSGGATTKAITFTNGIRTS